MLKNTQNCIFLVLCIAIMTLYSCNSNKAVVDKQEVVDSSLKEAFKDKFYIGTALNAWQLMGSKPEELNIAKTQFNSIVAENVMKSGRIQAKEGEFNFELADKFVAFGEQNDMHIHGHT